MIIGRNTEKIIDFMVTDCDGKVIPIEVIDIVEFSFDEERSRNQVIKQYYTDRNNDDDVEYDPDTQIFHVLLTQNETRDWYNKRIPVQIRIKFKDGTVESSETEMWSIRSSLSDEVL